MKVLEVSSHAGISLKNILLATDFSEASEAALSYAAAISRRYGSQLHLAHIISPASFIVASEPMGPITIDTCTKPYALTRVDRWRPWRPT
jgi:nucleotide-binding universal stress UspA family protein